MLLGLAIWCDNSNVPSANNSVNPTSRQTFACDCFGASEKTNVVKMLPMKTSNDSTTIKHRITKAAIAGQGIADDVLFVIKLIETVTVIYPLRWF